VGNLLYQHGGRIWVIGLEAESGDTSSLRLCPGVTGSPLV
jgi:hypothetical protein